MVFYPVLSLKLGMTAALFEIVVVVLPYLPYANTLQK
jgi:hypothetical protein